jgi:hypothetical protein
MLECRGCHTSFKTEVGLVRHLSKKVFCQTVMGIAVPPIHPSTVTLPLDLPDRQMKHKNKKRPAPPQLSHGLKPPPPFQPKKKKAQSALLSPTGTASAMAVPAKLDSHDLKRLLSGMVVDQSLRFAELQQNALHQHLDPDADEEQMSDIGENPDGEEHDDNAPADQAHTFFHDGSTEFADRFNGAFTHAEKLSIRLLAILRRIGAPNAAYGEIMEIISDALLHSAFLTSTFLDRGLSLNHLAHRFSMQPLFPTVGSILSPDGRHFPLVIHRAKAMVQSLLTSSLIEDDSNLLFPDLTNPLAPPPLVVTTLADIDTGRIFRRAYDVLCRGHPNHVMCGIILYIDKLAVDRHGHLSLEPVYFTLSMFNQKTRNKPQAWRPLGYIPNIGLMSKAESRHSMTSSQKVQLYHDILGRILAPLIQLQQDDPMDFPLFYRGQQYHLKLKFPLLAVLGDTESHDRLCGRYNMRGVNTARLCRHCDIPTPQTAMVDYTWSHILPQDIAALLAEGNFTGLKNISQHPIRNAFYDGICLGGNPRGIHGMTPAEPLHLLELGLFKYAIEGFCVSLGYVATSKSPPKILKEIDVWARLIGRYLGHQSDRGLPRTYFPNGVTGGTKLAGHEMNGVLLVLLLLCKLESSKAVIRTKVSVIQLQGWVQLFESLLTWRWWLKRPTLPMSEVAASEPCTKALLRMFKTVVNRQHGAGMLLIKFHICLHFFENNLDLGVTSNFDTGPMESNHKTNAKNPSKRTQMRAEGFEEGTAQRYIEDLVLDVASHELTKVLPLITEGRTNPFQDVTPLQGAKYTVEFGDETPEHEMGSEVTLQWDTRHVVSDGYEARHIQWLANHLLADLGALASVRGCTEHTRQTTRGGRHVFRAHPAYRGGPMWHDWALFQWVTDNNNFHLIPGHIVTFIHLDEFAIALLEDNDHVIGTESGLYAMIESLEEPLSTSHKYSRIVIEASKNLTADQRKLRRNAGIPLTQSNTFLLPVDTIYEPIAAVPNLGGVEGDYLFIRPADDWGFEYSKLLSPFLPEDTIEAEGN